MKINKVTMTGADDSTRIEDLVTISHDYPFVEWGILLSRSSQGRPRFPSIGWKNELTVAADTSGVPMQLSGHLCGAYVREILSGKWVNAHEMQPLWPFLQRIQINTHGEKHSFHATSFWGAARNTDKEFIFQFDGANDDIIKEAMSWADVKVSTLFDLSHGAGVLPEHWPIPLRNIDCGYAGGLGPDNIERELDLIAIPVQNSEIWIDMETKVRSDDGQEFDLNKVVEVLKICKASGFMGTYCPA